MFTGGLRDWMGCPDNRRVQPVILPPACHAWLDAGLRQQPRGVVDLAQDAGQDARSVEVYISESILTLVRVFDNNIT